MSKKAAKGPNLKFDFSKCTCADDKAELVNKVLAAPINPYDSFIPLIENQVPKIPNSTFKAVLPDTYWDFEDFDITICDDIGNNDLDVLFQNPTIDLKELQEALPKLFQIELFQRIQDEFPLTPRTIILEMEEKQRATFAALCTLIRSNNKNNTFLLWLAHNIVPSDWHGNTSKENSKVFKLGIFEKHKTGIASHEQYWAILDPNKNFKLLKANGEEDLQFRCENIDKSRSGNSLRVWKGQDNLGVRLVVIYDELLDHWCQSDVPLPCFFPYTIPNFPVPDDIAAAFLEMLLSSDTVVLRAMIHHEVFPVDSTGMDFVKNLYTIFASRGLINRLISTIVAVEFSHPGDLNETMVLRGNSHLTCLFKLFATKFAKDYFYKVIKPIIDKVVESGDINITPPKDESQYAAAQERVKDLLFFGIDKVLASASEIPPQFKHIASLLKICTSLVLRSKHAVFNALSSFMFLRFFTPAIVAPQNVVPEEKTAPNAKVTTVPFSRLIQLPFNLQQIPIDKYPHLKKLNEELYNKYADIYNFAMDIAEYDKAAKYDKTTDEEALQASKALLITISKEKNQRNTFIRRIKDLSEKEDEKSSVSFLFGNILAQCFNTK